MHPGTGEIEIAERTYSLVERTQGNHYEATLESDEGNIYTLRCHHDNWTCNCPDMKYRRPRDGCKHVEKLRERLKEQSMSENNATLSRPATSEIAPKLSQTLSPPAPSSQSGRTQLCIALAKAQQAVGRLGHDARNEYHRYDYTSSEAIIEAAKSALGGNGLCLLPLEETLAGHAKEGEDRFELQCKFVLLHVSGEQLPLVRHWPVCPEKGRPLDKATAAAATLALAYLLRDLLLIPRVNPDDEVPRRDDRPPQPAAKQKPAKAAGKTPRPPPKDGAELEARLKDFDTKCAAAGKCLPGELFDSIRKDAVKNGYPAEMRNWNEEQCQLAMEAAQGLAKQMSAAKARTEQS